MLLAALIFDFMGAAHLSFAKIRAWNSARERVPYEPEPEMEATAAGAAQKRRRKAIGHPHGRRADGGGL